MRVCFNPLANRPRCENLSAAQTASYTSIACMRTSSRIVHTHTLHGLNTHMPMPFYDFTRRAPRVEAAVMHNRRICLFRIACGCPQLSWPLPIGLRMCNRRAARCPRRGKLPTAVCNNCVVGAVRCIWARRLSGRAAAQDIVPRSSSACGAHGHGREVRRAHAKTWC